jgi:hypothetical protein
MFTNWDWWSYIAGILTGLGLLLIIHLNTD